MPIDVLAVNAFLEETKAVCGTTCVQTCYTSAYNAGFAAGCAVAAAPLLQQQINSAPCNIALWCQIPLLSGATTLNVCSTQADCTVGTGGQWNCGTSCTWTVPAGITCAQFQIWGAGGGSNQSCCCGGASNGGTGAYVTAILPVVAGCQYTVCAGCAVCCYPSAGGGYCGRGCASYVTGYGLFNLCAEGGTNYQWQNVLDQGCYGTAGGSYWCTIEYFPNSGTIAGPCICGNNNYCFQGCATCGEIVVHRNTLTNYKGSACNGITIGIPGLHGGLCLDTNNYGHFTNPPVICGTHTGSFGATTNCGCRICFTSETCLGGQTCQACCGPQRFPGMGGFAYHVMGGGNSGCGAPGTMGMVRILYK